MILGFVLILLAGICKSVKDVISFHYFESVFNTPKLNRYYWDPEVSWMNKYRNLHAMRKEPKFFGSTTFLVWTTDAWHFFQMLGNLTLIIGFLLIGFKVEGLGMLTLFGGIGYVVYTSVFELFYSKIFRK